MKCIFPSRPLKIEPEKTRTKKKATGVLVVIKELALVATATMAVVAGSTVSGSEVSGSGGAEATASANAHLEYCKVINIGLLSEQVTVGV